MAIEVLKCPVCGMRYNASDYSQCPYCANGMSSSKPVKERRWGRKISTLEQIKPSETPNTPLESVVEKTSSGGFSIPASGNNIYNAPQDNPGMQMKQPVSEMQQTPSASSFSENSVGPTMSIEAVSQRGTVNTASLEPQVPAADSRMVQPEVRRQETVNTYPVMEPASAPVHAESLNNRIQDIGKTTAKYISSSSGETIFPVVGWLVCVKGVYYGKSFPLRSGINKVSRSDDAEISLPRDMSVSSHPVVRIIYDTKGGKFNALPGEESTSLCYINGEAIYERTSLTGYEIIELGDSEKNMFVFVPLCGEHFSWNQYEDKK